jgi:hypothetical protein
MLLPKGMAGVGVVRPPQAAESKGWQMGGQMDMLSETFLIFCAQQNLNY